MAIPPSPGEWTVSRLQDEHHRALVRPGDTFTADLGPIPLFHVKPSHSSNSGNGVRTAPMRNVRHEQEDVPASVCAHASALTKALILLPTEFRHRA